MAELIKDPQVVDRFKKGFVPYFKDGKIQGYVKSSDNPNSLPMRAEFGRLEDVTPIDSDNANP